MRNKHFKNEFAFFFFTQKLLKIFCEYLNDEKLRTADG